MLRFAAQDTTASTSRRLGISVTRVPAYSPYAVAEHAVALLLALNRKIPRASNRVHDLNFSLNGLVGFDLHGKTAGILGTGKIGRVAAQILRGFGMRVVAFDVAVANLVAFATGQPFLPGTSLNSQLESW